MILIVKEKKKLYMGIDYSERHAVDTYHTLFQTP